MVAMEGNLSMLNIHAAYFGHRVNIFAYTVSIPSIVEIAIILNIAYLGESSLGENILGLQTVSLRKKIEGSKFILGFEIETALGRPSSH